MNAIGLMSGGTSGSGPLANAALLGMKGGMYHALDDNTTSGIQNPLMGGKMADEIIRIQMPSRILVLRNIATLEDLRDNRSFCDFYSDIMDKCSLYGKVLEIKIPRPIWHDRTE